MPSILSYDVIIKIIAPLKILSEAEWGDLAGMEKTMIFQKSICFFLVFFVLYGF